MLTSDYVGRLYAFLEKYGEKGLVVLKVAYEIATDPSVDHRLGDFSFKHLALKLASMGLNYNPANLLRILEKEYGVIEKTYSSSNQTWWRFLDLEAVRSVISEYFGTPLSDPKIRALLVKYKSIEPGRLIEWLKKLLTKENLSSVEKEEFKAFAFRELDKITALLEEMQKYEDVFRGEIAALLEILSLAEAVSSRLEKPGLRYASQGRGVVLGASARSSLLKDTASTERHSLT